MYGAKMTHEETIAKMGIEIEKMELILQKIRTHIEVMERCQSL